MSPIDRPSLPQSPPTAPPTAPPGTAPAAAPRPDAAPAFVSRPRDDERTTRKPLAWWDRCKFLILLVALFWFFVWADMADNPLLPFDDAVSNTAATKWWLFLLGGLEVLRQAHYLVAERNASYYAFWTQKIFGRFNTRTDKINPWTRYRLSRALKWILFFVVLSIVLGVIFDVSPALAFFEIPKRLSDALPFVFQLMFAMVFLVVQFGALFWFLTRGGVDVYYPDDVKTRFADVWGQDAVVHKIKENLIFLENPESIEEKGGYVPGGILLYGPPGTGKTLMAEAVAGETGKPYVFVDPGAFVNMFMGIGVLKVKSLFRKLRRLALRYGGVIVFFDEADSLGNRGRLSAPQPAMREIFGPMVDGCNGLAYVSDSTKAALWRDAIESVGTDANDPFVMGGMGGGGGGGDMGTLQTLLAELSGLKKPRGFINRHVRRLFGMRPKPPPKYRMLVMMATNMPESLDQALLRPGRIDRIYKVGYPSKDGRKRTFEGYLTKVRHTLTDADIDKLATISPYATGATIKDVVNEALVNAIREGRDAITWPDMLKAKHLKEHGLPDDFEYIERERHAVAIHEACHAVAAYHERQYSAIDVATIERRGDVGGFVSSIPLEDQMFHWKSEREGDIVISLASLAGERMFFDGDNSVGVGGDLQNATRVAMLMEGFSGMGSTIASHGVTKAASGRATGQSVETGTDRQWLETEFGQRVEEKLQELFRRAETLLERNRAQVLAVAHALEAHKTVSGDDIRAVIEGAPGPQVDGSVYYTPEAVAELEHYHDAAAEAHKNIGRIDVPLPRLNGRYSGMPVVAARMETAQTGEE
jgi:cell division protease FtsH